jgi:hypothetical protein
MKKSQYQIGGDTRYSKDCCSWCGAKEADFHKGGCKLLEENIYNQALEDVKKYE